MIDMPASHRGKLFLMMALEFFIWGAWLPLIFFYLPALGFSPAEQSWILGAFPLAAIVGLFFSNQFADRISRPKNASPSAISSAAWPCSDWPAREVSGRFSVLMLAALPLLRADAFHHQFHRLRQYEGGAEGVRFGAHGRNHRGLDSWRRGPSRSFFVDWGKVHAVPTRAASPNWLGMWCSASGSAGRRSQNSHRLDLRRGRRGVACPGRIQLPASAHATQKGGPGRGPGVSAWLEAG